MYYRTIDENQKRKITGCIEIENEDEIRLGRDACHCACNCFCSCACFVSPQDQDKDNSLINLAENKHAKEEYLAKMLQS